MKTLTPEWKVATGFLAALIVMVGLALFIQRLPHVMLQAMGQTILQHSAAVQAGLLVLLALLMVCLLVLQRRIGKDRHADMHLQSAKYRESNAQALMLYNTQTSQEEMLQGTLDILAMNHAFPVSLFYTHEELGGLLHLTAKRGAPENAKKLIRLGDGLVGEAGQSMRMMLIEPAAGGSVELQIETGFGNLQAVALLFCPVICRDHLFGVMALASTEKLGRHECDFIQLLCAQLGSALHNQKQFNDVKLLVEQLRARSEEIERKNKEIEEASRMKSEFLANMSHELRTPLNAIIGFSEVMLDGIGGKLTEEQKEYVSDILSSGQHLLSLINDILDLSKVESGHMALALEWIDPAMLISSGIAMLKEKAAGQRITLTQEVEPGLDKISLDIRKTKQIIYNLLFNAVKFTPSGGKVHIRLRRATRAEVVGREEAAGSRLFAVLDDSYAHYLEISVTDTGIGISHDNLKRLFQPFTQIDSSHSRQYDGSGLGLALVRRLAELHGGGTLVQSVPDEGSCFTVWLPWRDSEPTPEYFLQQATMQSGPSMPAGGRNASALILIVDDDPSAAKLLRAQLEEVGYKLIHASSAEDGLRLASEMQPDAIVLDVIMPGMNGWEMLAQLKQNAGTARIPVVIVSITNDPSQGFALGASQVLTKPVVQDDLLAALANMGFYPPQGETILVADDDPKAVALVSAHLKSAGYTPIGAYSGREAIELAISKKPALIVLDLLMPEVSGFDVVQALHTSINTSDIPIVILTAKSLSNDDKAQLAGRVRRIIEKLDFNPTILDMEVKRALARQRK